MSKNVRCRLYTCSCITVVLVPDGLPISEIRKEFRRSILESLDAHINVIDTGITVENVIKDLNTR